MPKHITKEQWNELTFPQKATFLKIPEGEENWRERWTEADIDKSVGHMTPHTGDMIDFLDKDFGNLIFDSEDTKCWYLTLSDITQFHNKYLVDVLWEAVKYKLNKPL